MDPKDGRTFSQETLLNEKDVMDMYDRVLLDFYRHTPKQTVTFDERGTNYVSQAYYMKKRVIASQLSENEKEKMNTEMATVNMQSLLRARARAH